MIKTYKVLDEIGLHARPASLMVQAVSGFKNDTFILYNGKRLTLKSIMAVMSLGVPYNDEFQVEVEGESPEVVFDALEKVLQEQNVI